MPLNNRLLNSALFIVHEEEVECVIIDTKKKTATAREKLPAGDALSDSIISFIRKYDISNTIPLRMITEYSSHNMQVFGEYHGFPQSFFLKHGFRIRPYSIADILGYAQWNRMGASMNDSLAKRKWASDSRILVVYVKENTPPVVSLVDNGFIVDGICLDEDVYYVSHLTREALTDGMMRDVIIDSFAEAMEKRFHPSHLFLIGVEEIKKNIGTMKVLSLPIIELGDALIYGCAALDNKSKGNPDFMIPSDNDFKDVFVTITKEDGTDVNIPIFQHR